MKTALLLLAMISCTVVANLLLKTGATAGVMSEAAGAGLAASLNWRTLTGLACFGMAGLLYAVVLRWLPLNVAVSFAAAQFVGVVIASALVLGERIVLTQWFGVILIAIGILTIGWSRT